MLGIHQVPDDIQDYDPKTFKSTIDNIDDVFKLPSYCVAGTKCSLLSACRVVGKWNYNFMILSFKMWSAIMCLMFIFV